MAPILAYLTNANADPVRLDDFKNALTNLGYVEGENFVLEVHGATTTSQYDELAALIVRRKADVIVGVNAAATNAARKATSTIPIVMTAVNDPVAWGFVKSLQEPGTNVTGTTLNAPHLWRNRLELLKTFVPDLRRVAVLINGSNEANGPQFTNLRTEAEAKGLSAEPFDIGATANLVPSFSMITSGRFGAFLHTNDSFINSQRHAIASLAAKVRLPGIYVDREYVVAGGLMSLGAGHKQGDIDAASLVAAILAGANPATIPVKVPGKFMLSVSASALYDLDIKLPPTIIEKIDEWLT